MAQDINKKGKLFDQLTSEITNIKKENKDLKEQVDRFHEDNVKAVRDIFKDMVSILDDFSRVESAVSEKGLDQTEEGKKIKDRFLKVAKRMKQKLEDNGVTEISIYPGDKANENMCNAIETEPDSQKENDTIISVEKPGYMFKGIVLRPAEVIIVKN